jgi:hypothetical protein
LFCHQLGLLIACAKYFFINSILATGELRESNKRRLIAPRPAIFGNKTLIEFIEALASLPRANRNTTGSSKSGQRLWAHDCNAAKQTLLSGNSFNDWQLSRR